MQQPDEASLRALAPESARCSRRPSGRRHRDRFPAAAHRARPGDLELVGSRALIIGGAPLTDSARSLAAVLDVRGVAYLSHTSGAWLWGIPGFEPEPIHTSRPFEGTRRPARLADHVHNLRGVPDEISGKG